MAFTECSCLRAGLNRLEFSKSVKRESASCRSVFIRAQQAHSEAEDALLAALDSDERKELRRLFLAIRDSGTAGPEADCS
jgi:hypothetical protein